MECTNDRKTVIYGIQGEGRGHASRSLRVIQHLLTSGYRVYVFTGGDALSLLKNVPELEIFPLPIFRFVYGRKGVNFLQSIVRNLSQSIGLLFRLGKRYQNIFQRVNQINPDFIITDFEPYLTRIANTLKIPVLSIDHQRHLVETDIPRLKSITQIIKLLLYKFLIKGMCGRPNKLIISSFYNFPLRKKSQAIAVGPFISEKIYSALPSDSAKRNEGGGKLTPQNHLTIYLKEPRYLSNILPTLTSCRQFEFEIFSDWGKKQLLSKLASHIRLCTINQAKFLESLASSKALITTAGNQVIGEALFLGKPILAFPKLNDLEQEINGMALEQSGFGESCHIREFSPKLFNHFMQQIPLYSTRIKQETFANENYDGIVMTRTIIQDFIEEFVNSRQIVFELNLGKRKIQYGYYKSKFGFITVR